MPKTTSAQRMRKMRQLNKTDTERKDRKLDTLFMFGCVDVAVILDLAGDIWFKGVDIARALDMSEPSVAVSLNVENEYTKPYTELSFDNVKYRHIPGEHPATTFVNERGMYRFVLRSRMPKARAFESWVYDEVLPSIRKHGKYELPDDQVNPLRELNDYLKQQVAELKTRTVVLEVSNTELQTTNATLEQALIRNNDALFSLKPKCVPDNVDPLKQEILLIISKNLEPEMDDGFSLYASRIQKAQYDETIRRLKQQYPAQPRRSYNL